MTTVSISADVDVRGALRDLKATYGKIPEKIIPQAINKVASKVRTEAAREISARMGPPFKVNVVRKSVKIYKASKTKPVAVVQGRGRDVSLSRYPFKSSRKLPGVTAKIGKQRVFVEHAFYVPRFKQIFIRATKSGPARYGSESYRAASGAKRPDLPIQRLTAPGVEATMANEVILSKLRQIAEVRFPIEAERALRFSMGLKNG